MSETTEWIRASRCTTDGCVEARSSSARIEVRDSKLGDDSPILSFTVAEWEAWLDGAKKGEFDFLLGGVEGTPSA